ncbi:MAG: DEAD/DEAH box helicase [Pyrinomonadaceae bacterium]
MKPFIPRPWQKPAIEHLLEHHRAALWKPVGSGKTIDVLTALDASSLAGEDPYPALAIGPLRVARKVWREEAPKWNHTAHMSVSQMIGDADTRGFVLDRLCNLGNNAPHEIYCINRENVPWMVDKLAGRMPFRSIIVDEARSLKGYRTTQGTVMPAKLAEIAWHPNVVNFWELTGTPSPNGLRDLWGQLHFLDKGRRLGLTYSAFEEKYFAFKRIQDALSHKSSIQPVIQQGADDDIHRRVRDICLSIDLRDYIDINKPFFRQIKVELPLPARAHYREMEKKLFTEIEGHQIEAFSAAAKSQKLMQIANGAAYLHPIVENDDEPGARAWKEIHRAKIEALESIIEETGEDVPIIVAYNFKSDLTRLLKAFPEGRHLHSERDEDDFKAGLIPLLFAHPASAGHGIDGFQLVCNTIVFFGESWDLELREQIIGRIGPTRQMQAGFDRPVYVYDIVAEDTIDEVILRRHESKRSVQDLLLEAVKARKEGVPL